MRESVRHGASFGRSTASEGASMSDGGGPGLGQTILEHMPWIASIGLFVAGLWSTLIGWLWKRQTQRIDNHGKRIGVLEQGKASNKRVDRLESWLRDDIREVHQVQRDMNEKLDRLLGNMGND